nr:amidase [uncultured bacterium]
MSLEQQAPATHYLSAIEVLEAFASQELNPADYLNSLRARIADLEPIVNALTGEKLDVQTALDDSAARYVAGTARALEGLPVVVKEAHAIAGHTETYGSPMLATNIAQSTSPIVERILEAGGIPFVRSTTPEFCIAGYTRSQMWGITRNPWNPEYSCGGSSGGSGAALAAGYAPLATGSDIGGSTRVPASFNGVVGYKPPFGRVPTVPGNYMDSYCTDGPMGRTVADVALMLNAIAGQHPFDHVSLPDTAPVVPNADLTGKRVAVALTLGDYAVEPEVAQAIADTEAWLVAAGAQIERVEIPLSSDMVVQTALAHYGTSFIPWIEEEMGADGIAAMEPYTRQAVELGNKALAELGILGGPDNEAAIHEIFAKLFLNFDALVCPVSGIPAFKADEYYESGIDIQGTHYETHLAAMQTIPFNIANRNPVLVVPVARSANNVPIGAQVVARPYDDATVFDVGAALEAARGAWYKTAQHQPTTQTFQVAV